MGRLLIAFSVLPLSILRVGRIKTYTLVWYYYTKLYRLLKEDKVGDKYKLMLFYSSSTNSLFPYCLLFVNSFHTTQNLYMLFWLLKDAYLTCKRCPFEVLLTPFWSPIKHLLLCCFITNWFSVGCRLVFYTCFYPYL